MSNSAHEVTSKCAEDEWWSNPIAGTIKMLRDVQTHLVCGHPAIGARSACVLKDGVVKAGRRIQQAVLCASRSASMQRALAEASP